MNFGAVVLIIVSLGVLLAILRYIMAEKNEKGISYGKLLTEILAAKGYTKANMPNEYPVYPGALEDKDTEEYIEFISEDILKLIK
ncbi:hypothetical protein FMM75_15260 [Lachnospiraceae bacterium MD335]|nr:hypothetical protein [Lachnospiraceae bacterium MD335]